MIAQSLSVNDIKGVVRLQKLVLTGSFSVEAVGAIILTLRFWPEYGFTRALRWGIFTLFPRSAMRALTFSAPLPRGRA